MIVIEKIRNQNKYSCNSCGERPSDIKITVGNADKNGNLYGMCMDMEFCGICADKLSDGIKFHTQNPVLKIGLNDIEIERGRERGGHREFT